MGRSHRSTFNLLAVSAALMEVALNNEQPPDTTIVCDRGDIIDLETRRETNSEDQTGTEEATKIEDLGATSKGSFTFNKAKPGDFAFIYGFGLGNVSTVGAGSGYEHTILPIDGDIESDRSMPSFTAAQRFGKTVLKRLYASMFINSVTSTFEKDSFVKLKADISGTGKYEKTVDEETVTGTKDATTVTLAANGVQGLTASERLGNVQAIRVELETGVWSEVEYSAVSDANPAEITITAPSAESDACEYKVLYMPTEPAWATFPARVDESALKVSEMQLTVGGKWNGTTFEGGRPVNAELSSIEHTLNNNMEISFTAGGNATYASKAWRDGRDQKLSCNKEFRDNILQQYRDSNETFGLRILVEGAEYSAGNKFTVELIFPLIGVLSAPLSVDGKKMAEAGDLAVLENETYGSVIVKVKNQVSSYCQ